MTKVCEQCKVEGRGEVKIYQKAKKAGGQYWANQLDASPHYLPLEQPDKSVKFCHCRNKEEFEYAKEHGGLDGLTSHSKPLEKNKGSTDEETNMFLTPEHCSETDLIDIADFNTWVKNVRYTCYQLAKDLNPNGDEYSLRVGTAGLIHDALHFKDTSRLIRAIQDVNVTLSELLPVIRELKKS